MDVYGVIAKSLVVFVSLVHIYICPYTKVEESFNLQAIHDIIHHGLDIDKYDHLEFSGVVPRTFLAPLFLAAIAKPLIWLSELINDNKFIGQYIVRCVLALCVLHALFKVHKAVVKVYSSSVGLWFLLITTSQFHFLFYASRPLPNTFALAMVLLAFARWIRQEYFKFIITSTVAMVVLRAEVSILLGLCLLLSILCTDMTIVRTLFYGIPTGLLALALTVSIDSYFWREWLWPEGKVLHYNLILNKSSDWGTSPFSWYLTSALPRSLLCSLLWVPVGASLASSTRALALPATLFVFLYSFLPHKELRFIIYVIPLYNIVAAYACDTYFHRRKLSWSNRLFALAACGHLLVNCVITGLFLQASHWNYPGGQALGLLHTLEAKSQDVNVHIDAFSAQTGVSRFGQLNNNWNYNKTENLSPGGSEMLAFTHLLLSVRHATDTEPYLTTHRIVAKVRAFVSWRVNKNFGRLDWNPISIDNRLSIMILKRHEAGPGQDKAVLEARVRPR